MLIIVGRAHTTIRCEVVTGPYNDKSLFLYGRIPKILLS